MKNGNRLARGLPVWRRQGERKCWTSCKSWTHQERKKIESYMNLLEIPVSYLRSMHPKISSSVSSRFLMSEFAQRNYWIRCSVCTPARTLNKTTGWLKRETSMHAKISTYIFWHIFPSGMLAWMLRKHARNWSPFGILTHIASLSTEI